MDGRIFQLKEKSLNDLQHQWTVEEMAGTIKISVPHFQKLFKSAFGKPPIAYLRELRLERARELLESDEFWQIQEIRVKVGIMNDSHFTRDFKKKYGITPTEYREQYWEKIQAGISDW